MLYFLNVIGSMVIGTSFLSKSFNNKAIFSDVALKEFL